MSVRFRDNRLPITAVLAGLLAIASIGLALWAMRPRTDADLAAERLMEATAVVLRQREAARQAAIREQTAKMHLENARAAIRIADSRRIAALSEAEQGQHPDRALILAVEAIRVENTFEARRSLLDALLVRPGITSFLHTPTGCVNSVAFSPDGKMMAAAWIDGSRGGGLLFSDVARRAEPALAVAGGPVMSVAFSPDGKTLAAATFRGLLLWDLTRQGHSDFKPQQIKQGTALVALSGPLAFSPDGKTLAGASSDRQGGGSVFLWDVARCAPLTEKPLLIAEEYPVTGLAFHRDGKTLATACAGRLELWDIAHSQRLAALSLAETESAESVAFSPDGETLAAGLELETGAGVAFWDVTRRQRLAGEPLAVAANHIASVAFSPDGGTVAAGCGDRVVLWKLRGAPPWPPRRWKLPAAKSRTWPSAPTAEAWPPDTGAMPAGEP